jgi:hypothetical protein
MPHLGPFDLLLCDPPYGLARRGRRDDQEAEQFGKSKAPRGSYGSNEWDEKPVDELTMRTAREKCKTQIIFGGNYYPLPVTSCWLVWDKENGKNYYADAELAWTNIDGPVRLKRHQWHGMLRKGNEDRWHPTQKPLAVMAWALMQAGDVQTVLDPWMGSGTTLRACKDAGVKCVGIEMQEKYCEIAAQRMLQEVLPLNEPTKAHHEVQEELFQR